MKKFSLLALLVLVSACGIRYTPSINTTTINSIDFSSDLKKEAQSCAYGILFFPSVAGADISVVSIAKNNGFKKVLFVDRQDDFYILFNRTCTVVYGQ